MEDGAPLPVPQAVTTAIFEIHIPDDWRVDEKGKLGIHLEGGRPDPTDEDLWQACRGKWILDIGAAREYFGASFLCQVVEEFNWEKPVECLWLDTHMEVQAWVDRWVRRLAAMT